MFRISNKPRTVRARKLSRSTVESTALCLGVFLLILCCTTDQCAAAPQQPVIRPQLPAQQVEQYHDRLMAYTAVMLGWTGDQIADLSHGQKDDLSDLCIGNVNNGMDRIEQKEFREMAAMVGRIDSLRSPTTINRRFEILLQCELNISGNDVHSQMKPFKF